ncbi:Os08g0152333 [Oryza sativa Japonica Group]|uniref:Os08g0152333 protein n=1 Tax=Oryza sativa subsp. japonica TaxID=39947 RepID=A0A0P0XC60_ORYSJ|nr:Os08g0152333 [Oryza sativa Japonica Group]
MSGTNSSSCRRRSDTILFHRFRNTSLVIGGRKAKTSKPGKFARGRAASPRSPSPARRRGGRRSTCATGGRASRTGRAPSRSPEHRPRRGRGRRGHRAHSVARRRTRGGGPAGGPSRWGHTDAGLTARGRDANAAPRCTSARYAAPRAATKIVGPSGANVNTGPCSAAIRRSVGSTSMSLRARNSSGPSTGTVLGPGGSGAAAAEARARSSSEHARQSSEVRE